MAAATVSMRTAPVLRRSSVRSQPAAVGPQRAALRGVAVRARVRSSARLHNRQLLATQNVASAPVQDPPLEQEWARITEAGVQKATELWQAARKMAVSGDWSGKDPVKKVWFSDVLASPKRHKFFDREWTKEDIQYAAFLGGTHVVACFAVTCFSWQNLGMMLGGWVITGMLGITLSFHRQLSHKSFETPKWLEYALAYCGCMAVQGDPIDWVSSHRVHHLHTDTPADPHTPYEGFWWSHCGWFLDNKPTIDRVGDRSNASDMTSQPFYRFMEKTYIWHVVASMALTYALGGWEAFVWAWAVRVCFVHHITWFVNSACHVWGNQQYNTGDLSRNNWWVGILAFGEGWHNNHHAFEFSCRHGLEWYQFDPTWYTIKALETFGLASKLKYPSEKMLNKLRIAA
jgi:stearoyl-CoA desaturase (delta-9 desaturase)